MIWLAWKLLTLPFRLVGLALRLVMLPFLLVLGVIRLLLRTLRFLGLSRLAAFAGGIAAGFALAGDSQGSRR